MLYNKSDLYDLYTKYNHFKLSKKKINVYII